MSQDKSKTAKTNVMRILDKAKVEYQVLSYDCGEFVDGLHTAELTGAPVEQSFKTLVVQGKSKEYYVLVIPIAEEIELKKAAKVLGEKSIEMISVKEIQKITGYIRGGCSPLGMKKKYKTWIQENALNHAEIYISGGRIGLTICLKPKDLAKTADAVFADITV